MKRDFGSEFLFGKLSGRLRARMHEFNGAAKPMSLYWVKLKPGGNLFGGAFGESVAATEDMRQPGWRDLQIPRECPE